MKELVFVAISFLGGVYCIRLLRSYDLYEKEPFWKMTLVTIWGGFWSFLIALILYAVLARLGLPAQQDMFSAFVIIGPVEELAKLLAFAASYFVFRKELNEPVDGMIYMACVALGFSLIENYLYAMQPDSEHLIVVRLLICTPMHIIFSVVMGLAVYLGLHEHKAKALLVSAYLYAIIMHGLYDSLAFNDFSLAIIFVLLAASYGWTKRLLRYVSAISPFRVSLSQFMDSYAEPHLTEGVRCPNCASTGPKATYSLGKIKIFKCDHCSHCISTRLSLHHIFGHFAGAFGRAKSIYTMEGFDIPEYTSFYTGKHWKPKEIVSYDLLSMDRTLDKISSFFVSATQRKWWFPLELKKAEE